MRTILAGLIAVSCSGPVWAQDAPSHEDLVKEMLGVLDQLTKSLGMVKDEESAKAAGPELKKHAQKWGELVKKAEGLPPPTREESDRLRKQFKKELETAQRTLFAEVERVDGVAGGRAVLREISGVLGKKTKE